MDLSAYRKYSGTLHGGTAPSRSGLHGVHALVLVGGKAGSEHFGEFPFALLDLLGRSVLMRTLDRIRAAGIHDVSVVTDTDPLPPRVDDAEFRLSVVPTEELWDAAWQQYRRLSQNSECVLVLRLGAWAEIDFGELVERQLHAGSSIVRAFSERGEALDIFAVSSVAQAEAAALLRGELSKGCIATSAYRCEGYVNPLATPDDLRDLTLDAFAGECAIRPCGHELRPGVWIGDGARVHRRARVVAPAYIGNHCCIHRAAVVTRGSSIERHSEIDCATVIDSSTVLPYTRVGAGLDVEFSVVGFRKLHSGTLRMTAQIEDPHLIDATTHFSTHLAAALSWFFVLLPSSVWRSLFTPGTRPGSASAAIASQALTLDDASPSLALEDAALATSESQVEPCTEIAITRRYGNE